jgi:hypothetical protein
MSKPPSTGSSLALSYPDVLTTIEKHLVTGRTESRAFLAWFLEHFYRLEETQAQDAICDGPDDKGIDGIYVDDNLERIDVFQSKLLQNKRRTLGDTQLREFAGTLTQLSGVGGAEHVADTTKNIELKQLIEDSQIAAKIEKGYAVRGVFVTNVNADANAINFTRKQPQLLVFDADQLRKHYIPVGPTSPVASEITFDLFGFDYSEYQVGDVKVVFAPLSATDLVRLDGLANAELFAWNVRQNLGRTKVNKDITRSIADVSEHKNFLLFHNGITILCETLAAKDDAIKISGYSVVNGCQSLTSLYDSRASVTAELRIETRLIQLNPDHELVERITHHSNNQNPINARDLQSNSSIQRRLQNEFQTRFGKNIFYKIKRGEASSAAEIIENEDAARELLAFDLRQPWSCHQTYKLFDDLHAEIFARPEVNADRVVVVHDAFDVITSSLPNIQDQLLAGYRLTRYFLLYLLREALALDDRGKEFCADPGPFLNATRGRQRVRDCLEAVIKDLVVDLNAELKERTENGNPFDYKRELKSAKSVRDLAFNILPSYQKAIPRGRATSFGGEWAESAPKKKTK